MPKIGECMGLAICMYYNDHPPPHFHVRGEENAIITIEGDVLDGNLSLKAEKLIRLWALKYQKELNQNWQRAIKQEPLIKLK